MGFSSGCFDVVIGSSSGFLRGLSICSHSLSPVSLIKSENITSMCWCDGGESKVFAGCHSGKIYSVDIKCGSLNSLDKLSKSTEGSVVGLQSHDNFIFTAYSSGSVKLFDHDLTTETLQLFLKGHLCAARLTAGQIAVGGKDVSLRIWDINNPKEPVFTAKNVRPSVLQLAEPIWISDISFVPRTNGKLVLAASRHGELDLYDLRCGQRRPVARHAWRTSRKHGKLHVGSGKHSAVLPDLATTRPITRALVYDNSPGVGLRVVAGNAVGELSVLDLRLPQEYSNISDCDSSIPIPVKSYGSRAPEPPSGVRCLAGASGCITQLVCGGADEGNTSLSSIEAVVNDEPIILVSSLDRYMRIYNRDTGKRLGKIYVKFPVTSFLVNSTTSFTNLEKFLKKSDGDHTANDPESHDESHNISETEQKEFDELWSQIPVAENDVDATSNKDNAETVNHKVSKRKRKK